ncbi:MAG TPA: HEAT repeat domain-containing protein [Planctomycetota bacterium]
MPAQQVLMASGEAIPGKVVSVAGHRAKVEMTGGGLKMIDVRHLDHERLADGTTKRHAARLADGGPTPAAEKQLARMQKGEVLALPELLQLTENCTSALVAELQKLVAGKNAAVRGAAGRALALAATKESMRTALDAALADNTGALWREIANALTGGACLGALEELSACADIEKGMASKDKAVRGVCAWIATKLGSQTAIPVLATFVADSDHHVRESAAVCLAEAGNDAGAKVLLAICKRERSPAMEANRDADPATRELVARATLRERIHACELLGKLRHAAAAPTLTALSKHADAGIASAAKKALEALAAK